MCENASGEIQTHTGMDEFKIIFCFTIGYKKGQVGQNKVITIIQLL
jgi:hypothetical protein